MLNLYFLLIFASANYAFTLVPWYQIHGVFNIFDVGNGLILLGVAYAFLFRGRERSAVWNPFTLLIVIYIISALFQPVIATMNYDQSLLDGLVTVRHQFYYFSFFLFLLLLDTPQKATKLLDMLTVIAVVLTVLGVINYFGTVIFYSEWAEGHGFRSGIKRAYIPAMPILSAALIWQFSKWITKTGNGGKSGAASILLLGAHFFRQSRGRLLGVLGLIVVLLFYKRKFKLLGGMFLLAIAVVSIAQVTMKENIFLSPFKTATQEVETGEGTWGARELQIAADMREFKANPVFGSGLIALRLSKKIGMSMSEIDDMQFKTSNQDLGYYHWIKFYGVAGIIWLTFFYVQLLAKSRKAERVAGPENKALALFAMSYVGFVIVTYVTLSHLTDPDGILLVCLTAVIIARLVRGGWNTSEHAPLAAKRN